MDLKRLVAISPLIGSFLVFMGFFKLYYFYGHWDINIISYLDFSEIILSFLNDLNVLVFFTLLLLFQGVVGIGTVMTIDRHIAKQQSQTPVITTTSESGETTTVQAPTNFPGIMPLLDEVCENHPGKITIACFVLSLIFTILFLCCNYLTFLYLAFAFLFNLYLTFSKNSLELKTTKPFCKFHL